MHPAPAAARRAVQPHATDASRRREHARINVAAQRRGLRSRPIGAQQLRRQQRIAQVQAAVFMDQQRAHDEAGLRIETASGLCSAASTRSNRFTKRWYREPRSSRSQPRLDQALRRVVVGEIGVEDDDFGRASPPGAAAPSGSANRVRDGRIHWWRVRRIRARSVPPESPSSAPRAWAAGRSGSSGPTMPCPARCKCAWWPRRIARGRRATDGIR